MSDTCKTRKLGTKNALMTKSVHVSTFHNSDRADMNWKHAKPKALAVGFFSRHILNKSEQRNILTNFMNKMKKQKKEDKEELSRKLEEYSNTDSPSNISTLRPKTAHKERRKIPYPELPTYIKYEVKPGSKCALCDEILPAFHEHEAVPCRVCDDVYHRTCLDKCGDLTFVDKHNIDKARSNIGWSCPKCSNLSLLLTTAEVKKMTEDFEKIDFNQDLEISLSEYLRHFSRRHSLTNRRGQLLPEESERVTRLFNYQDMNKDGKLDWWEFVSHEGKTNLAHKDKHDLVGMLTEKELSAAKATFNILDKDGDGKIKEYEAREAFQKWYCQFEKYKPNIEQQVVKDSDFLDLHANVFSQIIMEADDKKNGEVDWEDFILDQALYILCARPNITI